VRRGEPVGAVAAEHVVGLARAQLAVVLERERVCAVALRGDVRHRAPEQHLAHTHTHTHTIGRSRRHAADEADDAAAAAAAPTQPRGLSLRLLRPSCSAVRARRPIQASRWMESRGAVATPTGRERYGSPPCRHFFKSQSCERLGVTAFLLIMRDGVSSVQALSTGLGRMVRPNSRPSKTTSPTRAGRGERSPAPRQARTPAPAGRACGPQTWAGGRCVWA
jgi:hypothetical protein